MSIIIKSTLPKNDGLPTALFCRVTLGTVSRDKDGVLSLRRFLSPTGGSGGGGGVGDLDDGAGDTEDDAGRPIIGVAPVKIGGGGGAVGRGIFFCRSKVCEEEEERGFEGEEEGARAFLLGPREEG